MAEKVLDLGEGLELWRAKPDELREQDLNARSMSKPMFDRLEKTIGRDRRLESLPLSALTSTGRLEIISGHHRVRAARSASLAELYTIVDVTGLTPAQVAAKQLAHNAISGEDDPQLLARIFAAITDVDAQLEAFVAPDLVDFPSPSIAVPPLDLGLRYRTATVAFLPYELELFERAVAEVLKTIAPSDVVYQAEIGLLERWEEAMNAVRKRYDVRAVGTVLAKMADLTLAALAAEEA